MGSVRKTVPSCWSLKALSFHAGIVQKDSETAENDRLSVAIGVTSLPVGRPLTLASTSPTGSFRPDCRRFCTIFSAENACYAFSIISQCFCSKNRSFSCRNEPGRGPGSPDPS